MWMPNQKIGCACAEKRNDIFEGIYINTCMCVWVCVCVNKSMFVYICMCGMGVGCSVC